MRKIFYPTLIALAAAIATTPAAAQYAQRTAEPSAVAAPVANSVLLENNGGLQLASGQRVTVAVDAAGILSITNTEQLGWNAVAPGPGGSASVASTAQPGTVIYSLLGPVLKIESGLATPFNYSAVASLEQNGQLTSQPVKTCTVMPGRVAFEMWSATVNVPSVVVGPPVSYAGAPGCN